MSDLTISLLPSSSKDWLTLHKDLTQVNLDTLNRLPLTFMYSQCPIYQL